MLIASLWLAIIRRVKKKKGAFQSIGWLEVLVWEMRVPFEWKHYIFHTRWGATGQVAKRQESSELSVNLDGFTLQ